MAVFTATHGVEFGGQDPKTGVYTAWARFERDRDREGLDGVKVFSFSTDDAKVAARLRGVNDYGITEADPAPEA